MKRKKKKGGKLVSRKEERKINRTRNSNKIVTKNSNKIVTRNSNKIVTIVTRKGMGEQKFTKKRATVITQSLTKG